jgi:hypothetical protein
VLYFNADQTTLWLLIVCKKGESDNLRTSFLAQLREGGEDAL